MKPNIKARAKLSNQTVFQKLNAIAIENNQALMKLMTDFSTDFSVYVTIINKVTNNLGIISQDNKYGIYNPTTLPPNILSQNQIFFSLQGDITTGTQGSVTYEDGIGKRITFAFQCPQVSDNSLSIPLDQTDFNLSYYGTNQPIQWNPNGENWGPVNNFPNRGHPLYALFVIESSEITEAA